MPQSELLIAIVRALEAAGIEYMATGSLASSLQGEPRATHDLDLAIDMPAAAARKLVEAFPPPGFYLDEAQVATALAERSTFNLIDVREGDKADFWLLTDEPFDCSRFARRRTEVFPGLHLKVSSPKTRSWPNSDGPSWPAEARSSSWTPCASMKCNTAFCLCPIWRSGRRNWMCGSCGSG